MFTRLAHLIRRKFLERSRRDPRPTVWYSPEFRVPLEGLGLETRRSDLVIWSLLDLGVVDGECIEEPRKVRYDELAKVHTVRMLAALSDPEVLAPIFGATPSELPMQNLAKTIRLGCGATVQAAHRAASGAGPQVNLLGGFHHASPDKGGGFSVVNDIAVAIRSLRDGGFEGRIAVLDVDAHPPDGTADCVNSDPDAYGDVWIGSLSGSEWGELPGVDETVLTGAKDAEYLRALDSLLRRMPPSEFAFVVCGGDVLEGDRFGGLALTVKGAYERDRWIARHIRDIPSVWLSAGGYSDDAWAVLLNTVAALALRTTLRLPSKYDPLRARYSAVAQALAPPRDDEELFTEADLGMDLGMRPAAGLRLLETYSPEWIEHALYQYGVLEHVQRLGYSQLRFDIDRAGNGDRLRIFGHAQGKEHMLLEVVLDRITHDDESFLFVHWLTLRHPVASFTDVRGRLPNQDVPGLGLAREAGELLALVAKRLGLAGVALRPAAFHVAYTARYDFSFVDPARQGRFLKLIDDLGHVPLGTLTRAIAEHRVSLDGERYDWEPDLMTVRLDGEQDEPIPCEAEFVLHDEPLPPPSSAT